MKHCLWFLSLVACGGVVLPESSESSGPDVITSTTATTDTETTGSTMSTGTSPPSLCAPEDVFQGSDGCYVPIELCCPGLAQLDQPLDVQCSAHTEGVMPVALVCNPSPDPGPETDGRECVVFKSFICQGVEHVVLCCQG